MCLCNRQWQTSNSLTDLGSSKYRCLAKTLLHFSCYTHGLFTNKHFPARIMAVDEKRASDFLIILSSGLCTLTYQCNSYNTRFQVLITASIKGPVFWNAMPCTVVYSYQCCYKERDVSIFTEVIHQTTHQHMPEDIFLQKLKFYPAHWSTIVNKRTRLSVSHSVLPNFYEISLNQSTICIHSKMDTEIFGKLYRCSTMTVTAFCTTCMKMSFEEEIVLSSVQYSFSLLTFIQPGWYLYISAWFM
jgi:hypothetical protein